MILIPYLYPMNSIIVIRPLHNCFIEIHCRETDFGKWNECEIHPDTEYITLQPVSIFILAKNVFEIIFHLSISGSNTARETDANILFWIRWGTLI